MSNTSAAQWVKFFNASGIPSPAAATYAHIFVENRIQIDMLLDLNKEYLREMGITLMGDIISILRHAKNVSDQTARDRVLKEELLYVPVAAIPANPISPPPSKTTNIKSKVKTMTATKTVKSASSAVAPMQKPARRVLPEHEGKYKIKLPTGCTERSKKILEKKAKLYSDRELENGKSDVFQRLARNVSQNSSDIVLEEAESEENSFVNKKDIKIHITGLGKNVPPQCSSSIFERLGAKTAEARIANQIKPILKNSAKPIKNSGIVKAKIITNTTTLRPQKQKAILVKKVPIKSGDDDSDADINHDHEYDSGEYSEMDEDFAVGPPMNANGGEKIVKFASTAEVCEIAPEPRFNASKRKQNFKGGSIKARLDLSSKLHMTKRSFNLKASPPTNMKARHSPIKAAGQSLRFRSDNWLLQNDLPVHQRLGKTKPSTPPIKSNSTKAMSTLSKRLGNVNIRGPQQRRYSFSTHEKEKGNASVFDRLGFTK